MSFLARKHVSGGYCLDNGSGIGGSFCALELGQCRSSDQIFRSSRETLSAGAFRVCYNRAEVEDIYLGKCGDNSCAADEESCPDRQEFISADGSSPASNGAFFNRDPDCQLNKALFGSCDGRCVWSKDACQENETYVLSHEDNVCTCDKVEVGACKYPDAPAYCAVSPDACDAFQTYLSPLEVQAQENITCYLCRPPSTLSPTSLPTSSETLSSSPSIKSSKANAQTHSASFIAIYAVLAIAISIMLIYIYTIRKRQHNSYKTEAYPSSSYVVRSNDAQVEQDDISEIEDLSIASR